MNNKVPDIELVNLDYLFNNDTNELRSEMQAQINKNREKGSWHELPLATLYNMLDKKIYKLSETLETMDLDAIVQESADAANYLMMIVGNIKRIQYKQRLESGYRIYGDESDLEFDFQRYENDTDLDDV